MHAKAVVDTPAVTLGKVEAAEVSKTFAAVHKVPVHTPAATITKLKSQDTFETLGDVEAEVKRHTLGNVKAETQSNQKCKPKHLQTP